MSLFKIKLQSSETNTDILTFISAAGTRACRHQNKTLFALLWSWIKTLFSLNTWLLTGINGISSKSARLWSASSSLFHLLWDKAAAAIQSTPLVPSKSYLSSSVYIFPKFSFQSSPHFLFSTTFNRSSHPKSRWSLVFTFSQFPHSYQVEWMEALFLLTEVFFFFHKGFLTLLQPDTAIHCKLLWWVIPLNLVLQNTKTEGGSKGTLWRPAALNLIEDKV